ncbi:MAG: hypothetical protein J6W90_01935, partial [Verrucomicrobia bacterium]|nr:hypothetical protein [Verrucomicrobiota bacterium]
MKADKKAFLISLALHGGLLGAFLGGSAFINPTPKQEPVVNLPLIHLTQVPSVLTDEAIFNPGGAPEVGEPSPEPPAAQPAAPAPAPEPAPAPKVEPVKKPEQKTVKETKKPEKKAEPKKTETKPKDPPKKKTPEKVDLSKLVVKPDKAKAEREAKERVEAEAAEAAKAAAEAAKLQNAIKGAIKTVKGYSSGAVTNLGNSSASGTVVRGANPGNGNGTGIGPSVANYNQYVISLYDLAWKCPSDLTDTKATTTVEIKINKDGSIRSS